MTTPDTPDIYDMQKVLEDILPLAASRVDDMYESAVATHGDGKAHRCACYRRAQAKITAAYLTLGMTQEHAFEAKFGAELRQAVVTDCGRARGSCSWDGGHCVDGPADDLNTILNIPGAIEALAIAGAV